MGIFRRKKKLPKTVPVVADDHPSFLERWLKTTSSTAKQLMWFLTVNAVIWIYMSYLLAWFGKDQIAESLSTNVCTVILGGMIGYLTSSTIQNLSKYNPKLGGIPIHEIEAMADAAASEETNELADMIEEVSADIELGTQLDPEESEPISDPTDKDMLDQEQSIEDPGEGIVDIDDNISTEEVVG